ncbi:hypothetical protein MVEG_00333 [Podila verticillata NRRL 6337]|nr:hypothetical protein MVEG_00333 [Podila verticillata NRRL 6337]
MNASSTTPARASGKRSSRQANRQAKRARVQPGTSSSVSSVEPLIPTTTQPLSSQQQHGQLQQDEQPQDNHSTSTHNQLPLPQDQALRDRLIAFRPANPLELPEIRVNVGRYLDRRTLRNCLLVNVGWFHSFMPYLWMDMRPVYRNVLGSPNDYPHPRLMRKYSHYIRSFEYNGHGTILWSMIPEGGGNGNARTNSKLPPYPEIAWRQTDKEEAELDSWGYFDDDAMDEGEDESDLNGHCDWRNETLSEYEDRIEARKIARESLAYNTSQARELNKARNIASKILNDTTDYRNRTCNKLETLILTDTRASKERGCYYKNWIKLISQNKETLHAFELRYAILSNEVFTEVFNVVMSLPYLTELVLFRNAIVAQKVAPFLETLGTRLHRLELNLVRVDAAALPPALAERPVGTEPFVMSKLKILSLVQLQGTNAVFPMQLIKRCPNLESLTLKSTLFQISAQGLTELLIKDLPHLTQLSVHSSGMSDLDVSTIVKSVEKLERLDVANMVFGLMSTNNLTDRHHSALEHLDIRGCTLISSTMMQRILAESRTLKRFLADTIQAKDVVHNHVYPSWACLGLRELTLDIRGDPADRETSQKVYQQLGQLVCLEHLDISRHGFSANDTFGAVDNRNNNNNINNVRNSMYNNNANNIYNPFNNNNNQHIQNQNNNNNSNNNNNNNNTNNNTNATNKTDKAKDSEPSCLNLHLDYGLKELRTLVHLKKFVFRGLKSSEFGLVELKWCAKAWPRLEEIGGKLRQKRAPRYNFDYPLSRLPPTSRTGPSKETEDGTVVESGDNNNSTSDRTDVLDDLEMESDEFFPVINNIRIDSMEALAKLTEQNRREFTAAFRAGRQRQAIKLTPSPNHLAIQLRRLKLHTRIRVIHHPEDKITAEERRRNKYLFNESSDDDNERSWPVNSEMRYERDFW